MSSNNRIPFSVFQTTGSSRFRDFSTNIYQRISPRSFGLPTNRCNKFYSCTFHSCTFHVYYRLVRTREDVLVPTLSNNSDILRVFNFPKTFLYGIRFSNSSNSPNSIPARILSKAIMAGLVSSVYSCTIL